MHIRDKCIDIAENVGSLTIFEYWTTLFGAVQLICEQRNLYVTQNDRELKLP